MDMPDVAEILEAEAKALEEALLTDPRYRKFMRLKETIAEYRGVSPDKVTVPRGFKLVEKTKEEKIYDETTDFVKRNAGVVLRRAIARHLADIGLLPADQSGVRQLGVYMTRWPEFVSRGRGWVEYDEKAVSGHPAKKETTDASSS